MSKLFPKVSVRVVKYCQQIPNVYASSSIRIPHFFLFVKQTPKWLQQLSFEHDDW